MDDRRGNSADDDFHGGHGRSNPHAPMIHLDSPASWRVTAIAVAPPVSAQAGALAPVASLCLLDFLQFRLQEFLGRFLQDVGD